MGKCGKMWGKAGHELHKPTFHGKIGGYLQNMGDINDANDGKQWDLEVRVPFLMVSEQRAIPKPWAEMCSK